MTLEELKQILIINPKMTPTQINDFRETVLRNILTGTQLTKLFEVCEYISFRRYSAPIVKVLAQAMQNFVLKDDLPGMVIGVDYDWIPENLGDTLTVKMTNSSLPIDVKKQIVIFIDDKAQNILSQNLIDLITLARA